MFERVIRAGLRQGFRKGLLGGDQIWLALGAAALTIRVVQRLGRVKPEVVREELRPGQTLVITNLPEPS